MDNSRIELLIGGVRKDVTPIYSDKVTIDKERENGEMYYRTKLNGTIKFVGKDFDLIESQSLDEEMTLRVFGITTEFTESSSGVTPTSRIDTSKRIDITHPETLLATAVFTKMDCTFNYDDKICEVKATSVDEYDKLLAGINNEYDLVQLAPVRESVQLTRRGILQIYRLRDEKITNVIGNMSYEVDVNSEVDVAELTPSVLTGTYHFAKVEEGRYLVKFVVGDSIDYRSFKAAEGWYEGTAPSDGNPIVLTNTDPSKSAWTLEERITASEQRALFLFYNDTAFVFNNRYIGSDDRIDFKQDGKDSINAYYYSDLLIRYNQIDGVGFNKDTINTFSRVILNKNISGSYKIPTTDIASTNLNYRYVIPQAVDRDSIIRSFEVQDEPTRWGVDGDGKYFIQPTPSDTTHNMIPIGWSTWIPTSVWYDSDPNFSKLVDLATNEEWLLNDAYPLYSAMQVLFKRIDPTISFQPTSAYSEFLFGDVSDYITNHVPQKLFVTPITNVERTYYNQAARKGKITLKQILDMLRNTYQLYWFIDSRRISGRMVKLFRIEHIMWFRNGGSYSATAQPIIDLTSVKSPMWMKRWSEGINTESYDSKSLVKRYEFAWGGDVSEVFEGYPIDIQNAYAKDGKTFNASVANFVSDVDLIMSAPDVTNDDMFALIGTNASNVCPIEYISPIQDIGAPDYGMQNPYLSFYYLEQVYWVYDMGGDDAHVPDLRNTDGDGDGAIAVEGVQRVRKQSAKFPVTMDKVGTQGLVKTAMGEGQWTKASYNIEDGMVSMELALDIDDSQNNG